MKLLYTIFLSICSIVAYSQTLPSILNETFNNTISIEELIRNVPSSSSRFGLDPELIALLDEITDDYAASKSIIGLSAAINFKDGEIWAHANGISSDSVALTIDHSMAIGSLTKTIIAATILKLTEEGLVGLDNEIGEWITHDYIDPTITIRQCLNHTTGIYNYTDNTEYANKVLLDMTKIWNPKDILELMLKPAVLDKGEKWSYSNSNYLILGLIIESISGIELHEAVRTKILDQKGYDNIQLYAYEELNAPLADLWFPLFGNVDNLTKLYNNNLNAMFSAAWAAGAYISTPTDMTKWAKSLYKGELLTNSSMEQMLTPVQISAGNGYGLGSVIVTNSNGLKFYGHNGEILYSSSMFYFPLLDLSITISSNDGTENGNNLSALVQLLLEGYVGYTVDVHSINSLSSLNILPNPSNAFINLTLDLSDVVNCDISMSSVIGKKVFEKNNQLFELGLNQYQIDVSSFSAGIYFLNINIDGHSISERVVVTK